jgi:hypothetical protein
MCFLLGDVLREVLTTSSISRPRVVGAGGSCVFGVVDDADDIKRAWSLPSQIGQLFPREPITPTCFSSAP